MAKSAGRKRKQVAKREPSGRASRKGQDPRATVLAQHHRKGSLSQTRSSAAGRLVSDDSVLTTGMSREALHRAAERLFALYGAYQSAIASRRPMAVTSGGTSAPEDEARTLRVIRAFEDANSVLQRAGQPIRQATLMLCCEHHEENWEPPFWLAYQSIEGLKVLADHFGISWVGEDRNAA